MFMCMSHQLPKERIGGVSCHINLVHGLLKPSIFAITVYNRSRWTGSRTIPGQSQYSRPIPGPWWKSLQFLFSLVSLWPHINQKVCICLFSSKPRTTTLQVCKNPFPFLPWGCEITILLLHRFTLHITIYVGPSVLWPSGYYCGDRKWLRRHKGPL